MLARAIASDPEPINIQTGRSTLPQQMGATHQLRFGCLRLNPNESSSRRELHQEIVT